MLRIYGEALDRLRVRLNVYLVCLIIQCSKLLYVILYALVGNTNLLNCDGRCCT